ncbi:hypothetical protein [Helicobacter sp. 23-1045]
MTQEELNELILGNFEGGEILGDDDAESSAESAKLDDRNPLAQDDSEDGDDGDPNAYRVSADDEYPPPPTTKHKVVTQLDDVTKGLEVKATQVFDQLETISGNLDANIKDVKNIKNYLIAQKDLFEKLSAQFPKIATFKDSLQSCNDMIKCANIITDRSNESADAVLQAMDIMQYQDIHRQKIERVVNVMRTLAKYLNAMFETDVSDEKRVSSASYIDGDSKANTVESDEIERLIAELGKK